MINRVIDASLSNRFLVLLLLGVLTAVGAWSMLTLPVDAVPDVTNLQVQVLTDSPGLGPVEVEKFITFPVEAAMSGLPGVEEIRSVTRFGLSAVTVVFAEGTDVYKARQLVMERLPQARRDIPEGFGDPEMGPISTGLGEVYQFQVKSRPGHHHSLMELRSILDWEIAFKLRGVPGVVEVNTFGGELKTYEVRVNPRSLLDYDIPLQKLFDALRQNNGLAGGGYIVHSGEQRLIRGEGLITGLDDVADIVLDARSDGTPIRVKDVAEVTFAPMVRQGAVTRDGGGEAVTGIVMMLMGENSRVVVERVKERIKEIEPSLPEGVTIDPFYDRTELVRRTIDTVAENIITGAVLVVVMLLLLLGDIRAGLIVAAAIPFSALFMFTAMRAAGVSADLMSLGAVDFGIIVDGAVVMIENAVRRVGLFSRDHPGQKAHVDLFRNAAHEVGRPILFAGLIVIIVFLPVFSLQGIEGKMFRPMAFSFMSALVGALILSVTVMPVMASLFLARSITAQEDTRLVRWTKKGYAPLLRAVQGRPGLTVAAAAAAVAVSVLLATQLGAVFIPDLDEGDLAMQAWRPPSVALEQSVESTTQIERVLMQFPEVVTVVSKTGRPEIATDPMGVETSDIYIQLRRQESLPPLQWPLAMVGLVRWPEDPWTTIDSPENTLAVLLKVHARLTGADPTPAQREALRRRAGGIHAGFAAEGLRFDKEKLIFVIDSVLKDYVPSNGFSYSQPIELRFQELIAGVRSDIGVSLYGPDLDTLQKKGEEIARVLATVPGAADVRAQQIAGLPGVRIQVDRAAAARYGVNAADVLDVVRALGGAQVGQVLEGQPRFALQVRFEPGARSSLEDLKQLKIADRQGRQIPLEQLARLELVEGPAQVTREAVSRRILVECNVRGRDLAGFVAAARRAVDRGVRLPPHYYMTWGGQFENLQQATGRLLIAVPVALALVFVLLYMTFQSVKLTALIYLNVPVAATGGILALYLRDMPFSISAGVGFIALFGIAVMNGVVLVEHIRDLRSSGLGAGESVFRGSMDRLRPVLMTATTDALGFLPMAVSTTAGAEVQRPLATVVIGGVITSSLLTLVVLPAIYHWFEPRLEDVDV